MKRCTCECSCRSCNDWPSSAQQQRKGQCRCRILQKTKETPPDPTDTTSLSRSLHQASFAASTKPVRISPTFFHISPSRLPLSRHQPLPRPSPQSPQTPIAPSTTHQRNDSMLPRSFELSRNCSIFDLPAVTPLPSVADLETSKRKFDLSRKSFSFFSLRLRRQSIRFSSP